MRITSENQVASLGWALHLAGCVAVLAIAGSYYAFVSCPLNAKMDQSAFRVAHLEALNDIASQVRVDHSQMKKEFQGLQGTVKETSRRLSAKWDEKEFIDQVSSDAEALGIEVANYQVGPTEGRESYSTAEISFQCSGSFASICRLLDKVDHLSRLTEVSRLKIETNQNLERYPFQVTFNLYFAPDSHDKSMRGEVL